MDYSFTVLISSLADFILHIDTHLQLLAAQYGLWLYAILFLIIFCETGLVVTPFLPGDSLLFAAGSLAAMPDSALDPHLLFILFFSAALLGDNLNYLIGYKLGHRKQRISVGLQSHRQSGKNHIQPEGGHGRYYQPGKSVGSVHPYALRGRGTVR